MSTCSLIHTLLFCRYYIRECGNILGVTSKLDATAAPDGKHILEYIFKQVVQYKKAIQDD
jgi:hypothetical protein